MKIKEALKSHELWLETEGKEGVQFNSENVSESLKGANLEDANLWNANLKGVKK